eukprot:152188-Prymnesium_polylepis.1
MEALANVGELLEVEVDAGDAGVVWQPARVLASGPDTLTVCINGDEDFIEEYGPNDEGKEWRRPRAEDIPRLEELFKKGEQAAK